MLYLCIGVGRCLGRLVRSFPSILWTLPVMYLSQALLNILSLLDIGDLRKILRRYGLPP